MNFVSPNEKTTLLLNNAWQPITLITARAAFMHTLKGRITCLDKKSEAFFDIENWNKYGQYYDDQPMMRSAGNCDNPTLWPIPTIVIVTSHFFRKPKKKKLSLFDLAKIHKYKCQYCFQKFPLNKLTIDHVVPKSKGGTDDHTNRVLCCFDCNQEKRDMYPWFKENEQMPKPPEIPSFFFDSKEIREEWKSFIKGFC